LDGTLDLVGLGDEVPAVRPLLADLDLSGVVVTADALHTHADAVELLVAEKHAHYLFTVKANQCAARRRCAVRRREPKEVQVLLAGLSQQSGRS